MGPTLRGFYIINFYLFPSEMRAGATGEGCRWGKVTGRSRLRYATILFFFSFSKDNLFLSKILQLGKENKIK